MFAHSLVLIQDHRGRYLKHKDTGLGFCSEGGDSFSLCTLVGRSNCFALRHLNTLAWVTLEADSLVLGPNPAALELFTDLEKCECRFIFFSIDVLLDHDHDLNTRFFFKIITLQV